MGNPLICAKIEPNGCQTGWSFPFFTDSTKEMESFCNMHLAAKCLNTDNSHSALWVRCYFLLWSIHRWVLSGLINQKIRFVWKWSGIRTGLKNSHCPKINFRIPGELLLNNILLKNYRKAWALEKKKSKKPRCGSRLLHSSVWYLQLGR